MSVGRDGRRALAASGRGCFLRRELAEKIIPARDFPDADEQVLTASSWVGSDAILCE